MTRVADPDPEGVLLADVGGTNCRLLLQTGQAAAAPRSVVYSTDDFPSPEDAIAAFLKAANARSPRRAALAVAGVVDQGRARLTNTSWGFDADALGAALGIEQVILVNDLEAQARAVLDLAPEDFERIGHAQGSASDGSVAVVGPGTGLGVARARRGGVVTATEGGHVGFAPHDDVEMELLRLWRPHLGRVTNEHIVSGPGLVRLYRALGAFEDAHVEPIQGPEIVTRALAGDDALCVEAVERFAKILGSVCGDIVLVTGADALVLVGGIANSLEPVLKRGGFRARFEQRGPGGNMLTSVPTHLATVADLGLLGARALLDDLQAAETNAG